MKTEQGRTSAGAARSCAAILPTLGQTLGHKLIPFEEPFIERDVRLNYYRCKICELVMYISGNEWFISRVKLLPNTPWWGSREVNRKLISCNDVCIREIIE